MWRSWTSGGPIILAAMLCALAAGCNSVPTSGIDPSGERVFASPPAPVNADHSNERYFDQPLGQLPWDDVSVELHPRETVASIGSEVVLVAGVCGSDGYLRTNRRLEWSIDPGSVGQFVAVGETGLIDLMLGDFNRPRKITNTFAIGSTLRSNTRLNRGACVPEENVYVLRGQGWISMASAVEGTSNVTVFAPEVYRWDARIKSARIHWVDAQWRFPSPAINRVGAKHVFSTTVTRQTNQTPCERWRVRYEISDGPAAGFSPDGAQSVEVPTDSTGQASVEIFQKEPKPGTNKICIQVIRPGDLPGANGQRLVVGSGTTMMTWTDSTATIAAPSTSPPGLDINITGPAQATVGAEATFVVTVRNLGQSTAGKLIIKDRLDPGLEHPAINAQNAIERLLGDLAPGASQPVTVKVRVTKPGRLCHTVEVSGPGISPVSKQFCLMAVGAGDAGTPPAGGAVPPKTPSFTVKMSTNGKQLVVGETTRFDIEVANTGTADLRNLKVSTRWDSALEPTFATDKYRIENGGLAWTLDNLPAGRVSPTLLQVECKCVSATANACNRVSVTATDGTKVDGEACLEIRAAGGPPAGALPETKPTAPADEGLKLTVTSSRKSVAVGKELAYEIQVTNSGSAPYPQVSVTATIPEGMFYNRLGTQGPGATNYTIEGKVIRFDQVFEVKPNETLMYRVRVLVKKVGQYPFHVELSTPAISKPIAQDASIDVVIP